MLHWVAAVSTLNSHEFYTQLEFSTGLDDSLFGTCQRSYVWRPGQNVHIRPLNYNTRSIAWLPLVHGHHDPFNSISSVATLLRIFNTQNNNERMTKTVSARFQPKPNVPNGVSTVDSKYNHIKGAIRLIFSGNNNHYMNCYQSVWHLCCFHFEFSNSCSASCQSA